MVQEKSSDSDKLLPTSIPPIEELTHRTGKIPKGYVCPSCGHLAVDEDELIGMTCPKCLQKWLVDQQVTQLVPIQDIAKERDSALVRTIKVSEEPMGKHPYDETTKIIDSEKKDKKKKKTSDSDDRIPGL
jgi:DNA-directed RNA polymerase subunit RPC12/RpoP